MEDSIADTFKEFLTGRMAHKNFQDAINNFPMDRINTKIDNIPYTFWHLLEHIRIAMKDIIEYVLEPEYEFLHWPDDYWPPKDKKATEEDWHNSVDEIHSLLEQSLSLFEGKEILDLIKKIDHVESNHSILRELIMIIDHNAYHIGQFVTMRMIIN